MVLESTGAPYSASPRLDRQWKEWDSDQVDNLLVRHNRLPQSSQMDVLLELDLFWKEDLGLPLDDVAHNCVDRAREYGLLHPWLKAVQNIEANPRSTVFKRGGDI